MNSSKAADDLSPVQEHELLLVACSTQTSADFQCVVMYPVGSEQTDRIMINNKESSLSDATDKYRPLNIGYFSQTILFNII